MGELEDRLDDMLSRIAMETEEIKELEQQLTDGQILANEALQRHLEEIISGLQEYLRDLRDQANGAQQRVYSLQTENQRLQLHLEDAQRQCRHLEDTTRHQRQDLLVQREALSVSHKEVQALRDRQVELEAELQQLREELRLQGERSVHLRLQVHLDQTRTHVDRITATSLDPAGDQFRNTRLNQKNQNQDEESGLKVQLEHERARHQVTRDVIQDLDQDLDQEQLSLQRSGPPSSSEQVFSVEREPEQNRRWLQNVQQDGAHLLQQLRWQSHSHRRSLRCLDRKLRQLRRSTCEGEQLMEEQSPRESQDQTRPRPRSRTGGLCCSAGPTAAGLGSAGTQDSGVGLQYLSSPDRGRRQGGPPAAGALWTLPDSDAEGRDSGRGSRSSSRGHTPYHHRHHPPPLPDRLMRPAATYSHLQDRRGGSQDRRGGSQDRRGGSQHRHGGSQDRRGGSQDRRGRSQDRRGGSQDRRGGSQDRRGGSQDRHGGSQDRHGGSQDRRGGSQDRRGRSQDSRGGSQDRRGGSQDRRGWSQDRRGRSQDRQGGSQDRHGGSQDRHGGSPDKHGGSQDRHGWSQDKHGGSQDRRRRSQDRVEETKRRKKRRPEQDVAAETQRRVLEVCEEVQCVETTLLRRRAELRRADRLLLEAQSCLHRTRQQVEQQKLCLLQRREELRGAGVKVEEVRVEQQRLQEALKELLQQQEALLSQKTSTVSALRREEEKLLRARAELGTRRTGSANARSRNSIRPSLVSPPVPLLVPELKQLLHHLLEEQQALDQLKTTHQQHTRRTKDKQQQLDRKREELQQEVDGKREELQQEVDRKREEKASSC